MKIHFIGIGGIGMSALAEYMLAKGHTVSGSDLALSPITARLQQKGATIYNGHDEANVKDVQLCVYSEAVSKDNAEYRICAQRGIDLLPRHKLLAKVFNRFPSAVAVSGSHGKTTTCALLLSAFEQASLSPTAFVGGEVGNRGNFVMGQDKLAIAEACEYKRSFLALEPTVTVILNVDLDHVDCYNFQEDIESAFRRFAARTRKGGTVVVNGDGVPPYVYRNCNRRVVTYGFDDSNHFSASALRQEYGRYSFDCYRLGKYLSRLTLPLMGKHNVLNALATLAVGSLFELDYDAFKAGLQRCCGVSRRYTTLDCAFTNAVEDYAHHPVEIKALIEAAKLQGYSRIIACFQPHTYTRTQRFWLDFVTCFIGVDQLYLLPIYPAREQPIEGVDSFSLAQVINNSGLCNAAYCESFANAEQQLRQTCTKDDLVLLIGAGDIYKLGAQLTSK